MNGSGLRLTAALVLAGLVVLFVLQNAAVVQVRYLFWTVELSRSLLIFLVLALGILIGWLLRAHLARRRREET